MDGIQDRKEILAPKDPPGRRARRACKACPALKDNKVRKGNIQGPVAAWRLQTEPWTFVIARSGRIAARFEGPFSPGELERAIAKVA